MSKYTSEIRYICEEKAGMNISGGYMSVNEIIDKSRKNIFDFEYPIFDEKYKDVLEPKILKHFYTREICEETYGLWKLRLDTKLNEIMPYYNKLYKSELLDFNPLYTTNLTKVSNNDNKTNKVLNEHQHGNSENTNEINKASNEVSQFTNKSNDNATINQKNNGVENSSNRESDDRTKWDKYSDTPQGSISNVENNTYLTNVRQNTDKGSQNIDSRSVNANISDTSSTNNTLSSGNNALSSNDKTDTLNKEKYNKSLGSVDKSYSTDHYLEQIVGYTGGDPNKMLEEYRKTFLNIDLMILNELETLFMQLW